jgi:hypothetical protein
MAGVKSSDSESPVFDWPEWKWFNSIEKLLGDTLSNIQEGKSNEVGALYPFLDSIAESVGTLRTLVNQLKLRDAYVIARVIYETSVNACFLLTNPEALSARATTHAKQKALRSLIRAIALAGDQIFEFKPHGAEELLGDPRHQEWLREFTSRTGREITSWTPENVQQRLEATYLKFGPEETRGLAFGLLLYRHASEIAHGTLYGTLFAWGAMEPGSPLKGSGDMGKFRRRELRHLLKLVSFSLESVIRIVSSLAGTADIYASARKARSDYYQQRERDA